MKSIPLKAYPRTITRTAGVKKLRASGRIPAVIYGRGKESTILEVIEKEMQSIIHRAHSENILLDLAIENDPDGKHLALVQEVQHHIIRQNILHLDFHEVSADEKVVLTVPVETVGESKGVKIDGGVLEHVLFKVKLRAVPDDLPDVLEVDVSDMAVGETIHIGELPLPEGVEIFGDKNVPVIAVSGAPTEEDDASPEEKGEPEIISEKKEES